MTPTSALAVARDLAAAHPDARLPCPVCGQSLRAANLIKHLDKAHAGATAATTTTWRGADRRVIRPLVALTIAWTLGGGVALAVLPDRHVVWIAGALAAGLLLGLGLLALAAFDRLGARLELGADALRLRYGLGLLAHSVRLPAAVAAGRLFRVRPDAIADEVHATGREEGAGAYLRLTHAGATLVVRCAHDCALDQHWAVERGPRTDRWDITLARPAFVALEYALASRGALTVRPGQPAAAAAP